MTKPEPFSLAWTGPVSDYRRGDVAPLADLIRVHDGPLPQHVRALLADLILKRAPRRKPGLTRQDMTALYILASAYLEREALGKNKRALDRFSARAVDHVLSARPGVQRDTVRKAFNRMVARQRIDSAGRLDAIRARAAERSEARRVYRDGKLTKVFD